MFFSTLKYKVRANSNFLGKRMIKIKRQITASVCNIADFLQTLVDKRLSVFTGQCFSKNADDSNVSITTVDIKNELME